ncbi:MAG TPA: hypothetical protein VHA14_18110 [Bryobacteraceae bacterium]|nr:hypothetical protein [Bryobacteraceae bacterium]
MTLALQLKLISFPESEQIFTLADKQAYQSENLGSGTFIISKPKRKKAKMRQTRLKNVRRGSRK